ncbi:MAG: HEPN domain-containing protein [Nanoarchaeota archaeon]|nr:HEPN domain-containing protein [Nanoarchaeota archaeon]MBU1622029.1 HEPN domain-containing protein [Nanoarchaeota archaeon]
MENKKLKWCFKVKGGLKIVEPNERLSKSYLKQAKSSLLRAKKDFEDKDLLWTTVAVYYAEYYALYSFLQRIGAKCENHSCSILAVGFLLGIEKTKTINEHKDKRIDAQYYMKVDQENKVKSMLIEAQHFISNFDELVSNLSETEIKQHRDEISSFSRL